MAALIKGHIKPFWSMREIEKLSFETPATPTQGFILNDASDLARYDNLLTSDRLIDVPQYLISPFENFFSQYKQKVYAIHRMNPATILPIHTDQYNYYKKNFNVSGIKDITRIIIFLENRKPGHILEIDGDLVCDWKAGDYVSWSGNTKHLAANLGSDYRYTLQITGS